jgi:hypothetical protein
MESGFSKLIWGNSIGYLQTISLCYFVNQCFFPNFTISKINKRIEKLKNNIMIIKEKQIRAVFDDNTITVYQAYSNEIAKPALSNQKFVTPFKMERMTWIKPSFLWMMYRSGWATKKGQEYVLAIKLKRNGFEWALQNSCLSHFDNSLYSSPEEWKTKLQNSTVRLQWDPEKDIHMQNLNYRSIQIGLTGNAVNRYVNDWIVSIDDITEKCKQIQSLILEKKIEEVKSSLPPEKVYPLSCELKKIIHAS